MLLSIVIPTRNRSASLRQNLKALTGHIGNAADVEICVVDDNSTTTYREQNAALCQEYGVQYHLSTERRGPSHARNRGILATSGEWVAFLDDDVRIDTEWFSVLKQSIIRAPAAEVGIEGTTKSLGSGVWDSEVENLSGGLYITSNIAYRREVLVRCGCFDETFTGPFAEDQELALRIKKWGDIRFEKDCIVFHQPRKINLLSYCGRSFSRMRMLLDAEYYFFMKHRDRYHMVRHAATFWGSLGTILFKHAIVTGKRRRLRTLLSHPVQTTALILSVLFEQCAAWVLLPRYLIWYRTGALSEHAKIDEEKTAHLWHLEAPLPEAFLRFKPKLLGALLFRLRRKPVYNALVLLKRFSHRNGGYSLRLFLRVDDVFLDKKDLFDAFCRCMEKTRLPFLAAVTGTDLRIKENASLIARLVKAGSIIGLHGFTHRGSCGPYESEILQLSFPELDRLISGVMQDVSGEHRPVAFIPPFNGISWEQIVYLSGTFPLICGGPETLRFTQYNFGPVVLHTHAVYFPSCHPFYGRAADILNTHSIDRIMHRHVPVAVTVHLHAEAEDGFSSLAEFITAYRRVITDWRTVIVNTTNHSQPGVSGT